MAELRQVTALFGEIQGPVGDCPPLLLHEFFRSMADVVVRHGGRLVPFRQNTVLAYFGHPTAHEDDADRAVLAALEIRDVVLPAAMSAHGQGSDAPLLPVRLCVHTGMALLGGEKDRNGMEPFALGDAAGVVTRLPALGLPGVILVSDDTLRLLKTACAWGRSTEVDLRGLDDPLRVHTLIKANSHGHEGAQTAKMPPLQGRQAELHVLRSAWLSTAPAQPGRIVVLLAEPGMGKTLLMAHFIQGVKAHGGAVQQVHCHSYETHSAWYPFLKWVKERAKWASEDDDHTMWQKLRATLPVDSPADAVSALGLLLGLGLEPGDPVLALAPKLVRSLAEREVARWLAETPCELGTVVVLEDVHWADPTTLEFVRLLAGLPLCIVLTARPDFSALAMWPSARIQMLPLYKLAPEASAQVALEVSAGKRLPKDVLDRILWATDGNPFFIAEYTRAVIDSGHLIELDDRYELTGAIPAGLIPDTLRDSLTARLDRTGSARHVARHASVIGRVFSRALLEEVHPGGADAVSLGLDVLQRAGLVRPLSDARELTCEFHHALVQIAAYESMLRRERERIHAKVAESLDRAFPFIARQQPDLVARHLTESRQWVPAVRRWLQAASRSLAQCDYTEALAQVEEGAALLSQVPPPEAKVLELTLLSVQGTALIATTGFGSDQVGTIYKRTQELCNDLKGRAEIFPSLWGNWVYHLVRGNLGQSVSYAERMWTLGETLHASAMQVEGAWTQGNVHFWRGELRVAEHWLNKAVSLHDPLAPASHFGQDPVVAAHCYQSVVLTYQGRIDEGRAHWAAAEQRAQKLNHPFSMAWVLAFDHMYGVACDKAHALVASQRTLDFCYAQATPFWIASAHVVHGWATFHLKDRVAGLEELRMGIAMYESTGSLLVQCAWQGLLADCLATLGHFEEVDSILAKGMALADLTGERLASVQLATAQGLMLAAKGEGRQAVELLTHAQAVADACGAAWVALPVSCALLSLEPGEAKHLQRLAHDFSLVRGAKGLPAWEQARALLPASEA